MTLNIFSMIGIIMLMGLVTKNAILLVDFANQLREEGKRVADALIQAGMVRLRPILMTTAAMIFGMMPVALALSEGGSTRAPMASASWRLITSTPLTLVVRGRTFMDRLAHSPDPLIGRSSRGACRPPPLSLRRKSQRVHRLDPSHCARS
jgi:Cu/Ag efflux pump CusA